MNIQVREINDADCQRCLEIEKEALPNIIYVDDVWDYFTSRQDGYFLGVEKDGILGGFGKITRLFDDVGWLETLRIHPDYQGQGLGNAMYLEFLEKAHELGFKKLGLYTEDWNFRSESLAEKHGFSKVAEYVDYRKDVDLSLNYQGSFKLIEDNAEAFISKYYDKLKQLCIINKTFFPAIEGLGKNLTERKWGYLDDDNNFVVVGYRMQPQKALFLAYYDGDTVILMKF